MPTIDPTYLQGPSTVLAANQPPAMVTGPMIPPTPLLSVADYNAGAAPPQAAPPQGMVTIDQGAWRHGVGPIPLNGQGIYMKGNPQGPQPTPQPLPWWMVRNDAIRRQMAAEQNQTFTPEEVRSINRSMNPNLINALRSAMDNERMLNLRYAMQAGMPKDQAIQLYGSQALQERLLLDAYRRGQPVEQPQYANAPGGGRLFWNGRGWEQIREAAGVRQQLTPTDRLGQARLLLDQIEAARKRLGSPMLPNYDKESAKQLDQAASQIMDQVRQMGGGGQGTSQGVRVRNKQTNQTGYYTGPIDQLPTDRFEILR